LVKNTRNSRVAFGRSRISVDLEPEMKDQIMEFLEDPLRPGQMKKGGFNTLMTQLITEWLVKQDQLRKKGLV
jgi:hypothetical protein